MASIELEDITASRGGQVLVRGVSLAIADRERLVLLGASGSGKTSLLRVIAGVQEVDHGRIRIDGRDVTHAPPRERDLSMVTQDGSLQPHLDVRDNLGFSLRIRKTPRAQIDERVEAEARAFSLTDLLSRRPGTLAQGERHEVALARTLVRPGQHAVLVDEPFARIDAPRRATLLRELVGLQEGYGLTLVVATNDQRVAMGMAHRIAVLDRGALLQVDTAGTMHRRPADVVVAGAVGDPPMNLIEGRIQRLGGRVEVAADDLRIPTWEPALTAHVGTRITVGIRPTDLTLTDEGGAGVIHGTVRQRAFLGPSVALHVDDGQRTLTAVVPTPGVGAGTAVKLALQPADVHVFDAVTGLALAHGV